MTLKTCIEEMDLSTLSFANDILRYLDEQEISLIEPAKISSVDLSKVVGTTHINYRGKTWGELKPVIGTSEGDISNIEVACQPLKRAVTNIYALEKKPEYYLTMEEKDDWSFIELNGEFYISEGNNRTVIGRFFLHLNDKPPIIHGVKVTTAIKKNGFHEVGKVKSVLSKIFSYLRV
ncbi:hypothetical protein HP572_21590 [Pectobacterium sp. PL64]|uniref:hypothetical protein n=1 Tax=Pectobacterium TaxID=122277 RepID=UPI001F0C5185|nr:hypothetical protein [Pectobacterium sp. PL64]UMO87813.1 hypothetical protein HP572_21590 [Pectobacterium sp. PL64]